MMKLQIVQIDLIHKDKKGNVINLVRIQTTNSSIPILRREKEFLQDLKNSRLISPLINTIHDFAVMDSIDLIEDGTLQGDVSYSLKGDTWTVTAESAVVTGRLLSNGKSHPLFGKVSVGDTLPVEQDSARIEGFLRFKRPLALIQMQMNSAAYARAMNSQNVGTAVTEAQPAAVPAAEPVEPVAKKIVINEDLIDDYLNDDTDDGVANELPEEVAEEVAEDEVPF